MTWESPLSAPEVRQLQAILDNDPVAIFVSDVESRRVLYANRRARETLLPPDGGEACCYHIAGYRSACPFCHAGRMRRDDILVREYRHPLNGRVYQLSGKLVDWGDRPAHIEYVRDVTEQRAESERADRLQEGLKETFTSAVSYTHLDVYKRQRQDDVRRGTLFRNLGAGSQRRAAHRLRQYLLAADQAAEKRGRMPLHRH